MKQIAWVMVLVGIWLVIAPFVLQYAETTKAMVSDVLAGAAIAIASLMLALRHEEHRS